jgi:DNA polymerase-3 subunit beta
VSTDGHRMALTSVSVTCQQSQLLMPTRSLGEIRKLCESNKGGTVTISADGSFGFFTAGDTVLSARVLDAAFPKYRNIIPKSYTNFVNVSRDALLDVVKRVGLVSKDKDGGAITLAFKQGELRVSGGSANEDGEDIVECDADFEFEFIVNPGYLAEALANAVDDEVRIEFTGDKSPLIVRSECATGIVMPRAR